MSSLPRTLARTPTRPWTFWKFNWIVNRNVIAALRRARTYTDGTLLDIGCGARPFEWIFEGYVVRYLGSDLTRSPYLDSARPDLFARAEALPVRSSTIDTVLGLSVLTYLPDPQKLLDEASRVLRPGGHLLLEFTQMVPLHDEPHDYFRFTSYGARLLLSRAGLETVQILPLGGLWTRIGLSAIAALNRINRGAWRPLTELPVRALYIVIQLACAGLDRLFFDPREVVGHLVVARKPRKGS